MNRWGLMSALALAAALLLAGCGGDCGLKDDDSADEPQITLEQIRAANDPRSLLEKHGAVTVTVQESDQNDAVTYTAKFSTPVVWRMCWPGIIAGTPKTAPAARANCGARRTERWMLRVWKATAPRT